MAWKARSGLKPEADSLVLRAQPEGCWWGPQLRPNGTESLFCFGHGLGYTYWTYESLAPVAETITAGQDLPLVVTVRNSGERTGREVVQGYLEGPDDPSSPFRALAGFALIDADRSSRDLRVNTQVVLR
jgi:hypothetical protein